jgi:hypothetical protein
MRGRWNADRRQQRNARPQDRQALADHSGSTGRRREKKVLPAGDYPGQGDGIRAHRRRETT